MRTYDVLFIAGSWWLIYRDEGQESWSLDSSTHNIQEERTRLIATALNNERSTA